MSTSFLKTTTFESRSQLYYIYNTNSITDAPSNNDLKNDKKHTKPISNLFNFVPH